MKGFDPRAMDRMPAWNLGLPELPGQDEHCWTVCIQHMVGCQRASGQPHPTSVSVGIKVENQAAIEFSLVAEHLRESGVTNSHN